jgi:hypothetical protein
MRSLLPALVLMGCAREREPAPGEMEDLASFMIRTWEDDRSLEDALDNLAPWLEANAGTEDALEGFQLTPLAEDDVAEIDRPDANLADLLGASVAAFSPHAMGPHAMTIVLDDQVFSNPRNYESYARTVTGDVEAFLDGEGEVRTQNDVLTSNFGISIPYVLFKDYKWVRASEGREAIIARSWIAERGCNPSGANCLDQSFSADLWFAQPDDVTIRFTATWSQVTSGIAIGEDLQIAALANGMAYVFEATDTFITEGGLE